MVDLFKQTLEFRGLSRELLIEYILTIANLTPSSIISNADESVIIQSQDWSVNFSKEDTFSIVPTIVIPRLYITFSGDEGQIQEIIQKLRVRTLRTGG